MKKLMVCILSVMGNNKLEEDLIVLVDAEHSKYAEPQSASYEMINCITKTSNHISVKAKSKFYEAIANLPILLQFPISITKI